MEKIFKQSVWITLICILPITIVYASDENNNFYTSGKFISGISELDEIKNSGAITGSVSSSVTDDIVGGFSGAVGYKWQQFRFEAEYLWRYRFDFGAQFDGGVFNKRIIGSNIGTQSFMFNTLWDYENHTKFTPYFGGGIGWAEHEAETTRSNGSTVRPEPTVTLETTTGNFIWALMLGAKYSFTKNWNIDFGYRYADLGEVEMGPFANGGRVDTDYVSHDITIGISYNF